MYRKPYLKIMKKDLTIFKVRDKLFLGGGIMLEYLIAKTRQDELLREAEAERMLKQAKEQVKVIKGSNVDTKKAEEQRKRSMVHT